MAVKFITSHKNFIGLSTDTKPTSVPVGSKFIEYDRTKTFITYDGTNWIRES
ncbi:hypothetical protein LCGC14_1273400 [marine sediment metagenome]|uniref:Major tropism determinant N-terminal domain-containing protein n=1 Tax=marine sediment metagenome TaxID=412755 RepID=A0A0F9KZ52_9ZZZZ